MSTSAPPTIEPHSLRLHFGPEAPLSDHLFLQLCRNNPDLRLERSADGELIAMAPAGSESGARNMVLSARVGFWALADKTGIAFDSSTGFTLPNNAIRSPDASWIRRDRWEALSRADRQRFAPICPDFVVELRSPTDALEVLQDKMREYLDNGARLGWLIDPQRRTVEIYRLGRQSEALEHPATLSGEDVLPGFTLDLKGILFD